MQLQRRSPGTQRGLGRSDSRVTTRSKALVLLLISLLSLPAAAARMKPRRQESRARSPFPWTRSVTRALPVCVRPSPTKLQGRRQSSSTDWTKASQPAAAPIRSSSKRDVRRAEERRLRARTVARGRVGDDSRSRAHGPAERRLPRRDRTPVEPAGRHCVRRGSRRGAHHRGRPVTRGNAGCAYENQVVRSRSIHPPYAGCRSRRHRGCRHY